MNVELGLKKIESLELDKKNLLVKCLIKLNLWNLIYLLLDLLVLNLIKC